MTAEKGRLTRMTPLFTALALVSMIGLGLGPLSGEATAQGFVGDMMSGTLVDPKVGQWAWYELHDAASGALYRVRQAIVGQEEVDDETGYWVEFEFLPGGGYKVVFRLLLTGPVSNPDNVHRVIRKHGPNEAEEVGLEAIRAGGRRERPQRRSEGLQRVHIGDEYIEAERWVVTDENREIVLWINEDVVPSGIAQMQSPDGGMYLQGFGRGGEHAHSVIEAYPMEIAYNPDEHGEEKIYGGPENVSDFWGDEE